MALTLTRPLTYLGLLDDFASRHKDLHIASVHNLNQHLLYAALFGDPLLLNDGYVVAHPAIRDAVLTPSSSPLCALIETGHIKILTRNRGDLGGLVDQMADKGITSTQLLREEALFKDHYQPALAKWSTKLRSGAFPDSLVRWPAHDTSAIFRNVAAAAFQNAAADARGREQAHFETFRKEVDATAGRRTEWENVAKRLRHEKSLPVGVFRKLMKLANEAYQYSWGCALHEADNSIRVQTRSPKYLTLDLALGSPGASRRKAVVLYGPDLKVAGAKVGDKWGLLAAMVGPGHRVNLAKYEFLDMLERYYTTADVTDAAMSSQADAYSRELVTHFKSERKAKFIFDGVLTSTSTAAGTAVGLAVAGPPGALIGGGVSAAIGVSGALASRLGITHGLIKLTAGLQKSWITSDSARRWPDVPSSFQIDPSKAQAYLDGVPKFAGGY